MSFDLRALAAAWLHDARPAVVVTVAAARGSAPREAGTRMLVGLDGAAGTIGGGHLELKAIDEARAMLAAGHYAARTRRYPLGPALGQCCGGAVTLGFVALDAAALARWPVIVPRFRLQLHGAGHVGRAIAHAIAPLDVVVDWVDERDAEFDGAFGEPAYAPWPLNVRKVCVDAVEAEVDIAAPGTFFLVLTHRHDVDLRLAGAILRRGDFGFFGLIGSKTKRQRFVHRLERQGIAPARLARMTCPIGIAGIDGKAPEVIAASVVAQLLLASSSGDVETPFDIRTPTASPRRHAGCPQVSSAGSQRSEDGSPAQDRSDEEVVAEGHRDE